MINEAIILAGGLGTRLRSVVPDLPKCMAPVNDTPFISYVIKYLQSKGIKKFIFSLGYKHEIIKSYIDKNSSRFNSHSPFISQYAIEEEPLGTGGAIKLACKNAEDKTLIIVNGDTLFKIDLDKLTGLHNMCTADCTLSLKPMTNFNRYGVVELNKDYSVKCFREKQQYDKGLINGGVYAINTQKFLREESPDKFSFEKDYLEKLYNQRRIYGVVQDEYFIDIGIPEDYDRAQKELKV